MPPVEYDCEGCGIHVFGFGRDTVPKSHMCATCEWMCEFIPDPQKMMDMRRHLDASMSSPARPTKAPG